jgi:hypothetical protein
LGRTTIKGQKMKKTTEYKNKVIYIRSFIDPIEDQELYDRYLQLKKRYPFKISLIIRKLLIDWVEQHTKEKT